MRLTCKDKLEWNVEADQPFQDLKIAFTTTPILIHPNFSNPWFYLKKKKDKRLHPITFDSWKFSTIEINYEIYDIEFLAIVDSF
jgi:hypothetical protein